MPKGFQIPIIIIGSMLLSVIAACSPLPPPRGLADVPSHFTPTPPSTSQEDAPRESATERPPENLSLDDALQLAEEHHPAIRRRRALVDAATGRQRQAGAWPNPSLEATMESGRFNGGSATREAEYIAGFTQPLPLSGRLGVAAKAASEARVRQEQELELTMRRVRAGARAAYASTAGADSVVTIVEELLESSRILLQIARTRVEVGDADPTEVARFELQVAEAELGLRHAEAEAVSARARFGEAMGLPGFSIGTVDTDLTALVDVPPLEAILQGVQQHPGVLAAEAGVREMQARLSLAGRERFGDLTVGLFYRRLDLAEEDAFDVSVGFPLPLFNWGSGRVEEARAEVEAARATAAAKRGALETEVRRVHSSLAETIWVVTRYRDDIVPRIERILAAAEARYRAGDVSLATLLPIRQQGARLQLDYIDQLERLAHGQAALERLQP